MAAPEIIWRVNRTPRFTALTLGEYISADDGPRETKLRNMKYERLAQSLLYRNLNDAVTKFLTSPVRDRAILDKCRAHLRAEIANSANPQQRENLTYELSALETFERSLNALPMAGVNYQLAGRPKAPLEYSSVLVSVWPTAKIRIVRPRGADLIGAVIIDLAKGIIPKSDAAKARAKEEMTHSAVLLHEYALQNLAEDGAKVSPEHCYIFHTHRQELVPAPTGYKKMLNNMVAACGHISRGWDRIVPPPGFDSAKARFRN